MVEHQLPKLRVAGPSPVSRSNGSLNVLIEGLLLHLFLDANLKGGKDGGRLLCSGSPEEIIAINQSYTAKYLTEELGK